MLFCFKGSIIETCFDSLPINFIKNDEMKKHIAEVGIAVTTRILSRALSEHPLFKWLLVKLKKKTIFLIRKVVSSPPCHILSTAVL